MALHWTTFELRVRDAINEPQTGQISRAVLARWANEAFGVLPREDQIAKARIAIHFNNDVVTLVEEDWPGTEVVLKHTYDYGRPGAFYIKHGVLIDSIREIQQRDTGDDDACGDPVYAYDWIYPQLYLKRQEHITSYIGWSNYPTHYGCYRDWIHVLRDPVDNPRLASEPFEALVVWFDPMFDYSDADYNKWYEIQYRRVMPEIDLTEILDDCGDFVEYTQPYFYIAQHYEDIILKYVVMQVLFQLGDKRYNVAKSEYEKARKMIKWDMASRNSVDRTPRLEDPDAHILEGNRHGGSRNSGRGWGYWS